MVLDRGRSISALALLATAGSVGGTTPTHAASLALPTAGKAPLAGIAATPLAGSIPPVTRPLPPVAVASAPSLITGLPAPALPVPPAPVHVSVSSTGVTVTTPAVTIKAAPPVRTSASPITVKVPATPSLPVKAPVTGSTGRTNPSVPVGVPDTGVSIPGVPRGSSSPTVPRIGLPRRAPRVATAAPAPVGALAGLDPRRRSVPAPAGLASLTEPFGAGGAGLSPYPGVPPLASPGPARPLLGELARILSEGRGPLDTGRLRAIIARLRACLPQLPQPMQRVLWLRTGLEDHRPLDATATGRRLGISRRRVLALERAAVRRLAGAIAAGGRCEHIVAGAGTAAHGTFVFASYAPAAGGGVASGFYLRPAGGAPSVPGATALPPRAVQGAAGRSGQSAGLLVAAALAGVALIGVLIAESMGILPGWLRRGRRP